MQSIVQKYIQANDIYITLGTQIKQFATKITELKNILTELEQFKINYVKEINDKINTITSLLEIGVINDNIELDSNDISKILLKNKEEQLHISRLISIEENLLQEFLKNSDFILLKSKILKEICSLPFFDKCECQICYSLSIPVWLNFPCHYSNPNNGKPDCETTICMFCADKLMGLYANDITHVNCPTCRTPKELPECRIEAYSVNMNLLRSIDSYLHFENKFFMDMFGIPLNIIQCVQCDYYCSSLNELMNHVSFCKINK